MRSSPTGTGPRLTGQGTARQICAQRRPLMILVNLAEMPWSNERRRNAAMFLRLLGRPPFSSGIYVDPPTGSSRATNVGGRFRMAKDSFRLVEVEPRVRQYAPHF